METTIAYMYIIHVVVLGQVILLAVLAHRSGVSSYTYICKQTHYTYIMHVEYYKDIIYKRHTLPIMKLSS